MSAPGKALDLPHSAECECAVLALAFADLDRFDETRSRLGANDFYDHRHRSVFEAISELRDEGSPVDELTIQARLARSEIDVGGVAYLTTLRDLLPDPEHCEAWVATLTDCTTRRNVIEAAQRVVLSDGDSTQVESLRETLEHAPPDGHSRRVWTLRELLEDPEAVKLPEPTIPKLAWPGRATLLASPEKLGKSTLATAAAASVSKGLAFLAISTRQGAVLWATEEHVGDVARRLADFGADPDQVTVLQWSTSPLSDLRAEAERLRPALLVIDTLAALAEHDAPDSGSASQWAAIMRPLVRLARETGCALLILHHSRRSDQAYRDSSEIGAAVDVIAEMSGAATGTGRRIAYRGRYGRGSFSVRLVGHEFELVGDHDAASIVETVVEFIRDNPGCTQAKIRDSLSGRTSDKLDAIKEALAGGQIVNRGTDSKHEYYLTEAVPEKTPPGQVLEQVSGESVPLVPCSGDKEFSATTERVGVRAVPLSQTEGLDRDRSTQPVAADRSRE